MKLGIELDSKAAKAAFEKAPAVMNRTLSRYLDRAAQEVTDEARRKAAEHDNYGALKQSIKFYKRGDLERLVAPSVNYARMVEQGTKAGYWPNIGALMDWINTPGRRGFRLAKAGSKKRLSQAMELRERAGGLARFIHAHGTKAHPFMAPTAEKMESRVHQLLREGAAAGVQEVFG